jgi:hypothetical protein
MACGPARAYVPKPNRFSFALLFIGSPQHVCPNRAPSSMCAPIEFRPFRLGSRTADSCAHPEAAARPAASSGDNRTRIPHRIKPRPVRILILPPGPTATHLRPPTARCSTQPSRATPGQSPAGFGGRVWSLAAPGSARARNWRHQVPPAGPGPGKRGLAPNEARQFQQWA